MKERNCGKAHQENSDGVSSMNISKDPAHPTETLLNNSQ